MVVEVEQEVQSTKTRGRRRIREYIEELRPLE